jgi:hypothetical protein
MPTTTKRVFLLMVAAAIVGCTTTDTPSPSSTEQIAASAASAAGTVRINGLANFRQAAEVLTAYCSAVKFETDRRVVAQAAIDKALEGYGSSLPGGLTVDIQSLSIRMRCHTAGPSGFESYCVADARLAVAASSRDRSGQEIRVTASKDASERQGGVVLCVSGMPAVTSAVDKVLVEALADLQSSLAARTGIAR